MQDARTNEAATADSAGRRAEAARPDPRDPEAIVAALTRPPFPVDPYPLYAALREAAPIFRSEDGFWYATSYAAAEAVFRDPALGQGRGRESRIRSDPRYADSPTLQTLGHMLPFLDPPDHTRLRHLIARAFTPRAVERMRAYLERRVDGLLDELAERGRGELMHDLADHVPVAVICEMLGAPGDRHADLVAWADRLVAAVHSTVTDAELAWADEGARLFREYVGGLIEARRREPQDDLLTALVQAESEDDALDAQELLSTACVFIGAGIENTKHFIGSGLAWLIRERDAADRARRDPKALARALEEVLRLEPPVQIAIPRIALADTEVAGAKIRKGERLCAVMAAANRDPVAFPSPDVFDPDRVGPPNLSLAMGTHFCTGAGLARLEAQVVVGRFLARFPNARLLVDPPPFRDEIRPTLRGHATVEVELGL
ncbi:MAG: cytochrome P450 [Myxococcota bacterium]